MKICSLRHCSSQVYAKGLCKVHYDRKLRTGSTKLKGGRRRAAPKGDLLRFIQVAVQSTSNDCIIWPYGTTGGYGMIHYDGLTQRAHRVALEMFTGLKMPPTAYALHAPIICNNSLCINPRHLRWGRAIENMGDKAIDGTQVRGDSHPASILTSHDVKKIRRSKKSISQTAKEFGISYRHAYGIIKGLSWKHVK